MWYRRYRMLIGIYAIAVVVGAREYLVSRGQEPVDFLSEKWSDLTDVVSAINPGDPDTEFLEAVQALQQGDEETFLEHLEEALSADVKHNDLLLQSYAQHLLNTGTDHARVNAALNRWRENHPFSVETVWLPLASGPRNAADLADLNRALGEVPWVTRAAVESYGDGANQRWRATLTFRPGEPVDIRDAVAAASVLALPPGQRDLYEVTCLTLTDCSASRRGRR
jgi:hypothetical protein